MGKFTVNNDNCSLIILGSNEETYKLQFEFIGIFSGPFIYKLELAFGNLLVGLAIALILKFNDELVKSRFFLLKDTKEIVSEED
ncbi:hypothetical protein EB118_00405 [bacterium]|nr:hypothetical protein [bacterium]